MADKIVKIYGDARFLPRHDTLENWQTKNPILLEAEPSYVIDGEDGKKIKFGDGVTPWNDLPYLSSSINNGGSSGKDGISPTVVVTETENGHTVSITDVNGTKSFDVLNGADGQNGADGISATHSWNGTTLTITSASGTSSANLKGENGSNGYTPVRGTDYWTEADRAEIKSYVDEAILGGAW